MRSLLLTAGGMMLLAIGVPGEPDQANAALPIIRENGVQVINLTQVGCQFIESEGKDYGYEPTRPADCRAINAETLPQRQSDFEPLRLPAGDYVFRVTNENVPYEIGFWLRGSGVGRVTLPSVSGGGLLEGKTEDYQVTLRPGKYVYSCPKNPTPNYSLIVE